MGRPKIGLVLGSGSARGWSHAGIIMELLEHGIPIDYIGGTSIGALFGAFYANGKITDIVDFGLKLEWDKIAKYYLPTMPRGGLVKLSSLEKFIRQFMHDVNIEDLSTPYVAVAADALTGDEVSFTSGSLIDAAKASMALPGMVEPYWQPPRLIVDGGIINPIPIANVRALGAEKIIAVSLNTYKMNQQPPQKTRAFAPGKLIKGPAEVLKINRLVAWAKKNMDVDLKESMRFDEPKKKVSPLNIFDVLNNSFYIMQMEISKKSIAAGKPDILLKPKMDNVRMLDFLKAEQGIDEGRRIAKKEMNNIKKLLQE